MSATPAYFRLPDRLAAKADPALIGGDERHLAAIDRRLAELRAEREAELGERLAAPAGHVQQALERDIEVRRLDTRVRLLERYGVDLCLGRMVPVGEDPVYLGRVGLSAADGTRLLVDWRSPAAAPFFGATHGTPMGLASRRRYRWGLGRVTDYWDEDFTGDPASTAALDDQSAFIASLGASRSGRMQDVLATIQADQDAIIRAGAHGTLVVDGGPGTGKTVVALHRAAYLLYADPRVSSSRGGVLFVGPNPAYLAYVADILPGLGEEGVQTCTLRDLVPEGSTAIEEPDPRVASLLASSLMVAAVERAVRRVRRAPTQTVIVETEWADVPVTEGDWEDAFDAPEPGVPLNEARGDAWAELARIVHRRLGAAVPPRALGPALEDALRPAFDRAWPVVDAPALVAGLLGDDALLAACAPHLSSDERALLRRADPRAWTVAHLPLLDAARQLLGDPEHGDRERRAAAARAAQRERIDRVVENLIEADDGEGLVTMFRVGDLQDALVDEADVPAAVADELAGPFSHVIVDEAQELTDAEWAMIVRRSPSRSVTVVGDRAQARAGFPESWAERLDRVGLRGASVSTLTVNYRTPVEVMAQAEPVIRAVLPDANVPVSVRSTGVPVRHGSVGELDAILAGWLAENADGIACVIGDATVPSTERVRSLTPQLAKGLEFDLVVLVAPETWGGGVTATIDRYVAMTRATQQLVILDRARP